MQAIPADGTFSPLGGIPSEVFIIEESCPRPWRCGRSSAPVGASMNFAEGQVDFITLDYLCPCGGRWQTAYQNAPVEAQS